MQRLEVSGAVRPLEGSLGVKGLNYGFLSVMTCSLVHTYHLFEGPAFSVYTVVVSRAAHYRGNLKTPSTEMLVLITADNLLNCVPPCMTVMCHWTGRSASHRCTTNSLASTGYQIPVRLAACVRHTTRFAPAYTNIDVHFPRMTQKWWKLIEVVVF